MRKIDVPASLDVGGDCVGCFAEEWLADMGVEVAPVNISDVVVELGHWRIVVVAHH
jgi:hypothetical protein